MKVSPFSAVLAAAALAGCAQPNPPLLFGDITTFGIRIGNDTASAGGSISLGLKATSVAMVPVTALQADGMPRGLQGQDIVNGRTSRRSDAMSVFASFDSNSSRVGTTGTDNRVALGQVFATGLAAQGLTADLCRRANHDVSCRVAAPQDPANDFASEKRPWVSAQSAVAADGNGPYQWPLLFMRSDVFGVDIGGSQAQQGMQFVLGYGVKNLAIIPVVARDAHGGTHPIIGFDGGANVSQSDTLSVLGQFDANTSTSGLNFKLDRYFATGMAARNLGAAVYALATTPAASAATPATASTAVPDVTASITPAPEKVREVAAR